MLRNFFKSSSKSEKILIKVCHPEQQHKKVIVKITYALHARDQKYLSENRR